jgi:uncharacterized protein YbaR (Trm112 family)
MHLAHLDLLVCPACHNRLTCVQREPDAAAGTITEGFLCCTACRQEYPVVAGVPRFVPRDNYASGFGLEWTKHARTQYDSYSGIPASEQRFFGQTNWPRDLTGELILEVGSGSGRFTEQAALTGATVVSLDYSYAVFCFGMLQHTPSPSRAFAALPPVLKGGGSLCADIYKVSLWRTIVQTKYWVRPFTRRMNPDRLYRRVQRWVDFMWPLANIIRRLPKGYAINWRLLVADYSFLGLQGRMLKEWSYLDTFDMLAPRYDRPATKETFRQWAVQANLADIDAYYSPHGVVLRARASKLP